MNQTGPVFSKRQSFLLENCISLCSKNMYLLLQEEYATVTNDGYERC